MSARSLICPHCGQQQNDRAEPEPPARSTAAFDDDPSIPDVEGHALVVRRPPSETDDERMGPYRGTQARTAVIDASLLVMRSDRVGSITDEVRPAGPAALFFPRDEARGTVRAAEWGLGMVALPVLLPGMLALLLSPRLWGVLFRGGEVALTVLGVFLGGVTLYALGNLGGHDGAGSLAVVAIAAAVARVALRAVPVD
jgi:hypothetical protein